MCSREIRVGPTKATSRLCPNGQPDVIQKQPARRTGVLDGGPMTNQVVKTAAVCLSVHLFGPTGANADAVIRWNEHAAKAAKAA